MPGAVGSYAPWLAWAFVPSFATKLALDSLYSLHLVQKPTQQDVAARHVARMRVALISGYLIYQFSTTLAARESSAYTLLGVDQDSSVEVIRRAFRRLAVVYHPDKVGPQGERLFIALRKSHDVLTDPVKRFAYDRFGIGVLDWRDALSYREHMVVGLRDSLIFYSVNAIIYTLVSWFQKDRSPFSFWHITLLFFLISCEVLLITRPLRPSVLQILLPGHTQRDVVLLFHQLYTSATMAVRQLLPFLPAMVTSVQPSGPQTLQDASTILRSVATELNKLSVNAAAMRLSSDCALASDIKPFARQARLGPATITQAAEQAAKVAKKAAKSEPAENGDLCAGDKADKPVPATWSRHEDAYVELVAQSLICQSLKSSPQVLQAIRDDGPKRASDSAEMPEARHEA